MPYGVPVIDAPGIEDSICLLRSSSVTRIGSTQFLYQEQVLHWTSACASSKISLMFNLPPNTSVRALGGIIALSGFAGQPQKRG